LSAEEAMAALLVALATLMQLRAEVAALVFTLSAMLFRLRLA
jgi:hypothetical protein